MTTRKTIAQDALADLTAQIHDRADRVLEQRIEDLASPIRNLAGPVQEIEFDIKEAFQSAQTTRVRALPQVLFSVVLEAVFEYMKESNRVAHIEAFLERAQGIDLEGQ